MNYWPQKKIFNSVLLSLFLLHSSIGKSAEDEAFKAVVGTAATGFAAWFMRDESLRDTIYYNTRSLFKGGYQFITTGKLGATNPLEELLDDITDDHVTRVVSERPVHLNIKFLKYDLLEIGQYIHRYIERFLPSRWESKCCRRRGKLSYDVMEYDSNVDIGGMTYALRPMGDEDLTFTKWSVGAVPFTRLADFPRHMDEDYVLNQLRLTLIDHPATFLAIRTILGKRLRCGEAIFRVNDRDGEAIEYGIFFGKFITLEESTPKSFVPAALFRFSLPYNPLKFISEEERTFRSPSPLSPPGGEMSDDSEYLGRIGRGPSLRRQISARSLNLQAIPTQILLEEIGRRTHPGVQSIYVAVDRVMPASPAVNEP